MTEPIFTQCELCGKNCLPKEKNDQFVAKCIELGGVSKKFAIAKEALRTIVKHYAHPLHDHNWAYYTMEQATKALAELEKEGKT